MYQFIYDLAIHFAPAFLIGILHTTIPCEDKAIFFFWSFGISKSPKRSALILVLYGLGLLFTNLIITAIVTSIALAPQFILPHVKLDPYFISFIGALIYTVAAIILFFFVIKSNYTQKIHSKYKDAVIKLDWEKNMTPFLFGMVVGFAPCWFEIFIYSRSVILAITFHDFIIALIYVFYFGIGTFVGLIFIALIKQGTSRFIKPREQRKNTLYILMVLIIIVFNVVIMVVSILHLNIFPNS